MSTPPEVVAGAFQHLSGSGNKNRRVSLSSSAIAVEVPPMRAQEQLDESGLSPRSNARCVEVEDHRQHRYQLLMDPRWDGVMRPHCAQCQRAVDYGEDGSPGDIVCPILVHGPNSTDDGERVDMSNTAESGSVAKSVSGTNDAVPVAATAEVPTGSLLTTPSGSVPILLQSGTDGESILNLARERLAARRRSSSQAGEAPREGGGLQQQQH